MDKDELLAAQFEAERPHLRAVAFRMLGSLSEADDAVQESWLRLTRSGVAGIENLGGWLTTVVARICLNMLRSKQSRREEPLPLHVVTSSETEGSDPEHEAILADSVGLALLVVLETLTPAERRVAGLAAQGLLNAQIAEKLFVSEKTVEGHLTRVYQKLGKQSRAQLKETLKPAFDIASEIRSPKGHLHRRAV